jgi:hypothetical protein
VVCDVELVPRVNWNNGLSSLLECSSMRLPLLWNIWMDNCSQRISLAVLCIGCSSDIVSVRVLFSWMFYRLYLS